MTLLAFDSLDFSADGKSLLNNCSNAIEAGDFIMLYGQSGSGKSLLLRALCGLQALKAGTVTLSGKTNNEIDSAHWRSRVALIAQQPIMSGETVTDTLKQPFYFAFHQDKNYSPAFHEKHLQALGKDGDFLQKDVNHLSGGEKQLVNLLRTIQLSPEVLLLDEPTAALDAHGRHDVEFLVKQWLNADKAKRAVLWVSHDEAQFQLGNRCWQMRAGKLQEASL